MRRSLASARRSLATQSTAPHATLPLKVTTLPNGVRVATDPTPGHFVAAGVYVDAGSRYEGDRTRGAGHMVDRLGFKSTANRTADQMTTEIEALGGQFLSSSSRETIMYQASTYTHSLPSVLSILSDTVQNPLITPDELDAQRDAAAWEIGEIKNKPEMILPEILHEVAFQGNTLGNPLLCPEERLETIDTKSVKEFLGNWYRPERIVVASAGVEHDAMLELADKFFGDMKAAPIPKSSPSQDLNAPPPQTPTPAAPGSRASLWRNLSTSAHDLAQVVASGAGPSAETWEALAHAPARYTGGELYLDKADSEFTHLYVGYEGLSIHDPDIYALATLQVLLGGGGSFSAGGPGKGMYSRLYRTVLNQYRAVDFCSSFHHCYLDSGLFGINISVDHSFASQAPGVLAQQFETILKSTTFNGIGQNELERGRNQLKSSLAMALESRMVQVEDLGRQVQVHGHKVSIEEMTRLIDAVTLDDIYRVANRVIRPKQSSIVADHKRSGKPTIVAQGKLANMPDVMNFFRRRGLA